MKQCVVWCVCVTVTVMMNLLMWCKAGNDVMRVMWCCLRMDEMRVVSV